MNFLNNFHKNSTVLLSKLNVLSKESFFFKEKLKTYLFTDLAYNK